MNQQTITAIFVGILCSYGCSNTTFGAVGAAGAAGEPVVEEGGAGAGGSAGAAGAAGRVAVVEPEPEGGAGSAGTDAGVDGGGFEDVEIDAPEPPPSGIGSLCATDADCSDIDGGCRYGLCSIVCTTSADCGDAARCVDFATSENLVCAPTCTDDADCFAGQLCTDGVCTSREDLP